MMKMRIRAILPMLAMCIAMSEAAMAHVQNVDTSAEGTPPPTIAVKLADDVSRQNAGLVLHVVRPLGPTRASDVRPHLRADETDPGPPVDVARHSALVLSWLGMLGMIALLRLNRAL